MHTMFQYIPRLAKIFSPDSLLERLRIVLQLWYFVLTRKLFRKMPDFALPITFTGTSITYHLRQPMDISVLKEVYSNKEYEWCPITDPVVIVDLGAHFGDTALYYHARFPDAKIIAVEPSPESFERLTKHVQDVPNIVPVQAALGSADGTATLNIGPSSLGNSLKARNDTYTTISVPQITLTTLFAQHGIEKADLIKFDIEGGEYEVFESNKPEEYADAYVGEVHTDLAPTGARDLAERFEAFTVERDELPRGRYLMRAQLKQA